MISCYSISCLALVFCYLTFYCCFVLCAVLKQINVDDDIDERPLYVKNDILLL